MGTTGRPAVSRDPQEPYRRVRVRLQSQERQLFAISAILGEKGLLGRNQMSERRPGLGKGGGGNLRIYLAAISPT
jgi:hypothetical protein